MRRRTWRSTLSLDVDAAPAGAGVEDDGVLLVDGLGGSSQEFEVEVADGVGVPLRQSVERTVAEQGAALAVRARLVPGVPQYVIQRASLRAEIPAGVGGQSHQCVTCGF